MLNKNRISCRSWVYSFLKTVIAQGWAIIRVIKTLINLMIQSMFIGAAGLRSTTSLVYGSEEMICLKVQSEGLKWLRFLLSTGLFEVRAQEYLETLPSGEHSGVNKFLKGLGKAQGSRSPSPVSGPWGLGQLPPLEPGPE